MIDYETPVGRPSIRDFICVRRALWMSKLTLNDIIKFNLLEKMVEGKLLHSLVRLKANCEYEVKGTICGRNVYADAICEDERGKFVVEIKTVLTQYIQSALFQLKAYMTTFKIPRGVLVGVIDRRIRWVYFDNFEEFEKDLCNRIRLYNEGREVAFKGEWCNNCPFRLQCDAIWYF